MASVMIAKGIRASMQIIRGPEIENHIDDLGRFRIKIFREYPYLYDGNIEFERVYLDPYSRNPESLLLILQDARGIIGACTGTPLTGEDNDFQNAFMGENKDEIYYIGAVILRADSRGQKLGSRLLSTALSLIDMKRFKKTSLCTVDRGLNHPRRPGNYCPPDCLWEKYGFVKSTNLLAYLAWTDIGQKIETKKPMNIWFKINSEKEE
jgi:GNAT superfamily N-acetyltransferase